MTAGFYDISGTKPGDRRVRPDRRKQSRPVGTDKRRSISDRRKKGDRRTAKRIYKKITTRFQLSQKDISETWDIIFLENIGAGGVLFKLSQDLPLGTLISMKMTFPGEAEPIACKAKVIRVQKSAASLVREVAAYFVEMDPGKAAYINKTAEKFYAPGVPRVENGRKF